MNPTARRIDVLKDLLAHESFAPLVREILEAELRRLLEPKSAGVMLADALAEIDRLQSVVTERDNAIAILLVERAGA